MKNRTYFVINNVILILGLISVFYSTHPLNSFEYHIGKTLLSQSSHFINTTRPSKIEDSLPKDAIVQYDQVNFRKHIFLNLFCKESMSCLNTSLISKQNNFVLSKLIISNDLFISYHSLRI